VVPCAMALGLTICTSCRQPTRTVRALCPNCGAIKDHSKAPLAAQRDHGRSSLLDDEVLLLALWFAPGLVLLAVALVVATSELLFLVAIVALLGPLVLRLLDG
jgi:hypothetical protein